MWGTVENKEVLMLSKPQWSKCSIGAVVLKLGRKPHRSGRVCLRSVKEIEAGCVRARYTPAQRVLIVRMKTFDEIHGWW